MEATAERPVTDQAAAPETAAPHRRVGTFTLGLTLLGGGGLMLASTFLPDMDLAWSLKLCPLILICLGVETLLAARTAGRIRYDWAGIVLCFLLSCLALGLYAASWGMSHWAEYGDYYDGSRVGNQSCLLLDYRHFNNTMRQDLELKAGDVLEGRVIREAGSINAYVIPDGDQPPLFQGRDMETGEFRVEIPADGTYLVCVTGRQAAGSFQIQRADGT